MVIGGPPSATPGGPGQALQYFSAVVPSFSVVIPTFRRAAMLSRVLPSYLATGAESIVVVDDGSGPPHDAILAELAENPLIRVVSPGIHLGLPAARNLGVESVTNEWVVFGEDDCWYPPEYPATLIEHAGQAEADIASGSARYVDPALLDGPPSTLDDAVRDRRGIDLHPTDELLRIPLQIEHLPNGDVITPMLTAGAAIRGAVFQRVRFDPQFTGNAFREETDFYLSCWEAGIRTIRCMHAVCGHLKAHRQAGGGAWTTGRIRYALDMLINNRRMIRKHAPLLREFRRRAGRPGGVAAMQAEFIWEMIGRLLRGP
jgi:glycosyltransferase involved in cell wall biosynthesis